MYTDQYIDVNEIMNQLSSISVQLNIDYEITSVAGNLADIGINNFKLSENIFQFLPQKLAIELKKNLDNSFRKRRGTKTNVRYLNINNEQKRLRIISNLISNDIDVYYLVTFLKLPDIDIQNQNPTTFDYESYKEAIKQLKFSEEKFNSFLENDPVMHISVNPETGLIADCNKYVLEKLELQSKNEIVGRPICSIYSEESKKKCSLLLEKFKREGKLTSEEMELVSKKGKIINVILYTIAQRNESGKIIQSRSTLVDITELKNTQRNLKKKRNRLVLLNKELEQFVSTCSHDLQEPLATIKLSGSVLKELYSNSLDAKGKEYLKYIDEAVDRLTQQIRSLLAHAKIGVNSKKSLLNTVNLVNIVIKDLGNSIQESNAKIIVENLPNIEAYATEIRLLFQNLISNAIKYSSIGTYPKIKVSATECEQYTTFAIEDNGIGISEIDQGEIFKIFNRVNESDPNKGTGVGLAHCDKIIRMHEGKIWVKSNKIKSGSTFYFSIKK